MKFNNSAFLKAKPPREKWKILNLVILHEKPQEYNLHTQASFIGMYGAEYGKEQVNMAEN